MRMGRFSAVLTIAAGAIACGAEPTAPDGGTDGARRVAEWLGQSETGQIGLGETAVVAGVAVTYLALEGDSRCPIGVTCVWEGDAGARLRVVAGDTDTEIVLHTALDPKFVVVEGLELRLVDVLPYPVHDAPTDPADTEVVVRVRGGSGS